MEQGGREFKHYDISHNITLNIKMIHYEGRSDGVVKVDDYI